MSIAEKIIGTLWLGVGGTPRKKQAQPTQALSKGIK